jgi:Domain of unknown function (DU1801)
MGFSAASNALFQRCDDPVRNRQHPPAPAEVAAVFSTFPASVRATLLQVRELIFETAAHIEGVGALTEMLKWGEPAYLTEATGSGSTIRLGWFRSADRECAVLFNCRTTLVDDFRSQFPEVFAYEKNRALLLASGKKLPEAPLTTCLGMALTYHRRRQGSLPG